MKRMSLKTLAKHLNLSEGTVSRALNGYSDISAKTVLRVREAAQEFDYKPNQMARRLAIGTAEAVAYVLPRDQNVISEPFVASLLEGLGEALTHRGWDLLVSQSTSASDETDMIKKLIGSGRVSGVVLSRPLKNDARIDLLKQAKFPFIVHGRSIDHQDYAWYDIDSEQAFCDAVDHLVGLGHQRIGLIGSSLEYNFAQMRLDGYKRGLTKNDLTYIDEFVVLDEMSDEGGERAANALLNQPNRPTAIMCMSDTQAFGVLAAMHACDLVPGKDISVMGYDGVKFGRHSNPPLTTMAQPQARSGRALGEMLLAIIDGGAPKDFQELSHAELVQRKTDGPAPDFMQPKI